MSGIKFPRRVLLLPSGCMAAEILTKGGLPSGNFDTKRRRQIEYECQSWKASRLSYHLNCEAIPKTPLNGKEGLVLHNCDNDWCIAPNHLYFGTAKQNTADIYNRNPKVKDRLIAALIGNKNALGKKWSDEAKAKRSEILKGNQNSLGLHRPRTEEQKENYRKAWTPERKAAQSEKMKGNTKSRRKDP